MDSDKDCVTPVTVDSHGHLSFLFWWAVFTTPLFQFDSLRLFMEESPAPLQTSHQCKAEEAWRGRRGGGAQKNRAVQKNLEN